MTRSTLAFFLTLATGLTIAACEAQKGTTAPAITPTLSSASANAASITDDKRLAELRRVTEKFHRIESAKAAGYTTQITPCWAHHSAGGMGYHYGNTALFDATVDLMKPETVMYEPQAGGHMKLVGMEYIVPIAAWTAAGHDAGNPNDVPQLLGQKFTQHSFLPIYKLHIWLWENNPNGTYADWNPKVSCQNADSTVVF